MLARLTAIALTLLTPATAFACINKMVERPYDTYPLDFLHVGVAIAAAVALWWSVSEKSTPSFNRKIAYTLAATIAGAGIGLFGAKVLAIELTGFVWYSLTNLAFVLLAILIGGEKEYVSTSRKAVARFLLILAMLGSIAGAVEAFDGHESVITGGFGKADPNIASQVEF